MGLFIFLAILVVIVLIHEAGHLITAKMVGARVNIYSIGFGPRIIGFKFSNKHLAIKIFNFTSTNETLWKNKEITEYRISPVLFGGYCAIEGEITSTGKDYELASKPYLQKCFVVLAGVTLNILTGFLAIFLVATNKTFSLLTNLYNLLLNVESYQFNNVTEMNEVMGGISFPQIIFMFGMLSILMGVFNLIPFPCLDGSFPFLWLMQKWCNKTGKNILRLIWYSGFVFLMLIQVVILYVWIWG